jgi:NADPH oxidase
MLWNIAVNDAGADYDPLTLLRTRTMFGRPDWKSIYSRMRQAIETGQYIPGSSSQLKTTVGVCWILDACFLASILADFECYQTYFCGPTPIAKAIKEATAANSSAAVNFTFAKVSVRDLEIHLC